MKESNKSISKKDSKGRILNKGEDQLSDGRYRYRFTVNGKRKTVYSWRLLPTDRTPENKEYDLSLREKIFAIQKDLADNMNIDIAESFTVNMWIEKYLGTKIKLAKSTIGNYNDIYKRDIKPSTLGQMKLKDVRVSHVKEFYIYFYTKKHFKVNTLRIYQNLMYPAFEMAVADDIIRKNPCKGAFSVLPVVTKSKDALTRYQEIELLNLASSRKTFRVHYLRVAFLLGTGLRISECNGLRWEDIDFNKQTISVDHQCIYDMVDGKMTWYSAVPKNKESRVIPLNDELSELLSDWKNESYDISMSSDFAVDNYKHFVFINADGKLSTPQVVDRALKNMVKAYNDEHEVEQLPNISAHILRHTFCTRMAEEKMDVKVLQYIMGHKTLQMTMEVYNHVDQKRVETEIERIQYPISLKPKPMCL